MGSRRSKTASVKELLLVALLTTRLIVSFYLEKGTTWAAGEQLCCFRA